MTIEGSIVALVTPMAPDGAVDVEALNRLVDFHIEAGSDAIVAMGTTGEPSTLDDAEYFEVIRLVVDRVAGRMPVIAGTGANSTAEAIALTTRAKEIGADACLLVTPYYNKPIQEGLYQHFKAVAEAVDIPQILYNVPARTVCDLLPATVARLASVPNIVGIKDATGCLERLAELLRLCGPGFTVYSGDDPTGREACLLGAKGVISVTANVAPTLMHAMCRAALLGEWEQAAAIDARLAALHQALFIESNPIPVKWALCEMGLVASGIRLPLTWLSPEHRETVKNALRQAGVT
jgi:4-hydroxy-tetrahydrodipicolinate synthase